MNTEADRTLRLIRFEAARQTIKKLLSAGELSESDYAEMEGFLSVRFGVNPDTGIERSEAPAAQKQPVDERFLTYANLTEAAKLESDSPATAIVTWLRSHKTFEFLREWERANNPDFNEDGYQELMMSGNKTITPKLWCEKTNAIGIVSRQGNKGGTYAHHVIAADFMMWNSALFRYTMICTLADNKQPKEGEFAEL